MVRGQKNLQRREREKKAEQRLVEVGVLLSKLRAANKGGNSWNSFLLNNRPHDDMLTSGGQRWK